MLHDVESQPQTSPSAALVASPVLPGDVETSCQENVQQNLAAQKSESDGSGVERWLKMVKRR